MVADLSQDHTWIVAIAMVLVATAAIVTLIALIQNQLHVNYFFVKNGSKQPGYGWGPFFHHTSAGAYLNTAWPLAAALAALSRRFVPSGRKQLLIATICLAALILLLGAHASHISRFPQVAALLVVPFFLAGLKSSFAMPSRIQLATVIGGILLVVFTVGRSGDIAQRWKQLKFSRMSHAEAAPPENLWPALVREDLLIPNRYNAGMFGDRGEAQRAAWRAIGARPLTGHGPGNWLGAVSHYSTDPYVRTFYLYLQFTHEDFLQAWVEWGLPGCISLVCLLTGGLLVMLRFPLPLNSGKTFLSLAAATGLAAVLLQSLIDFPLQIPAVALNTYVLAGQA